MDCQLVKRQTELMNVQTYKQATSVQTKQAVSSQCSRMPHLLSPNVQPCAPQLQELHWLSAPAGFPLSWLQKIPGLFQDPKSIFQDFIISQQCLNIETNSSY